MGFDVSADVAVQGFGVGHGFLTVALRIEWIDDVNRGYFKIINIARD
jgi:hypothetical protein